MSISKLLSILRCFGNLFSSSPVENLTICKWCTLVTAPFQTCFWLFALLQISYTNKYLDLQRGINASEWLIIDRHKYSESGAVCDLIGTSYRAFVTVNSPCTRRVGYCLSYQLGDFIKVN
jgi:hypothetical protein